MRTLSWCVATLLLAMALSGCTSDDAEPTAEAPQVDVVDAQDQDDGGVSYALDEHANETEMEGAHLHDTWGAATELVLMSDTVTTGDCVDNPFFEVFLVAFGVFSEQSVQKGCAEIHFEEGVIVPEGTGKLHVTLEASEAAQAGGIKLYYSNEQNRFVALEGTTEPEHTWTIEMEAIEWDVPHTLESTWSFFVRPEGNPAILDGQIDVKVVAERLPDWEPILASAHLDHWNMPETHDYIDAERNTVRLLDTNTTITFPSYADRITGNDGFAGAPFSDILLPGTRQVTLTVVWQDVQDCPPAHGCWVVPFLNTQNGGNGRARFHDPVESGPDWGIYVFDSPDDVAPDSTYAEQSVWSVHGFIRACPNGEPTETPVPFFNGCQGEAVASMSADTRIEVEAWRTDADLGDIKDRLGLA